MRLWIALAALVALLLPIVGWLARKSALALVRGQKVRVDRFKLRRKHPHIRQQVFSDPAVVAAIEAYARDHSVTTETAARQARIYLTEIVPKFNLLAYYRFGAPVARLILRFLYWVVVDRRLVGEFSENAPRNAVFVYVINHRSNADYVLVAHMLFKFLSLSYAVGEWARVWPLNHLFKWFGGYFIRRRYREPLYHAVLRSFVQTITRNGVTQGIFIEGGLTRDGAFRKPKVGMLDYIISSKGNPEFTDPLYIMPTAINYDRVLEDRNLTDELLGKEDRRGRIETLSTTVEFLFKNAVRSALRRFKRYGYAVVSFGEPILVDEVVAREPSLLAPDFESRKPALKELADLIMERISSVLPATPVPVVAEAFRRAASETVPEETLLALIGTVRSSLVNEDSLLARMSDAETFQAACAVLQLRHLIERTEAGWRWAEGEILLRDFYANSLVPYSEVKARGWNPS